MISKIINIKRFDILTFKCNDFKVYHYETF